MLAKQQYDFGVPILTRNTENSSNNLSPEKVKYFRKNNGWSQDVLAKAAGLSLRTIQRVEKDGTSSAETQLSLAAVFEVSPADLIPVSDKLEVNWKRKLFMQNFLALLVVIGAVGMLVLLGGDLVMFADYFSALFLGLFIYAATVIAFGSNGLMKSITGLRYLFSDEVESSSATRYLALILQKQITFAYGASAIGVIIGIISINSNFDGDTAMLYPAYAVCLLMLLYATLFAEGVLRPLVAKLTSSETLAQNLNQ